MRSRVLLGTLFGALGGFVGFLLQEHFVPHDPVLRTPEPDMIRLGLMVGAMLGLAIGAVEGVALNSPRIILRGTVLGTVIGAIGGMFGIFVGARVYQLALLGHDPSPLSGGGGILDFTHNVLARALGWTFLGAFPGLAAGASTLSRKRALHGLMGGLLGGFLGGFVFDLVANTIALPVQSVAGAANGQPVIEVGGPSRAIGFTVIGALTGLFIGLVEELLKQAWVRVLAGKNEGKDYIISKALTVFGRDERADVPLFGDPNLAPQHAAIRIDGNRHVLLDGGNPMGSVVNGQRVQQQLLRDGDMIQLGQVRLLFREKATATKVGRPVVDAPKSAQAPGAMAMPSHLCPFCGAQKDASGNCLCSVPGTVPAMHMPQTGYGMPPPYPDAGADGADPMMVHPAGVPYGDPAGCGAQPYPGGAYPVATAMGGIGSRINVLEGVYAGQVFQLASQKVTIGRDPAKDVALTSDTTISRSHAHIAVENGQHVIYDDGSSNGTFVNNVRVSIQTLAPGDVIQLGASKLRYE